MTDIEHPPFRSAHPFRTIAVVSLLAAGACTTRHRTQPVRAANAAGDAACLSCHREKESFEHTAHRLTSVLPTSRSIAGRFSHGENVLQTSSPYLHFRMDSTTAGFYEAAVTGRPPDTSVRSERIAFVVGSGAERPDVPRLARRRCAIRAACFILDGAPQMDQQSGGIGTAASTSIALSPHGASSATPPNSSRCQA